MKTRTAHINRLINSVGTETFIKYFDKFVTLNREELITLFKVNNEVWEDSSKKQKASNGKRIFNEKLEVEALEHIILKKKENNIPNGAWVKKRAKEIYYDYNLTNQLQSEVEKTSQMEREILVKYRLQQGEFRKNLLLYWEGCSITECKNNALLIASHIKPYSESNDDEKYDINNGLLLTPTFDKLFDRYLISFTNDGTILISESIDKDDLTSLKITGNETLRLDKVTSLMKEYLEQHRIKFELNEKTIVNKELR